MSKGSKVWGEIKSRGEYIGLVFFVLGLAVLLVQFGLVLYGLRTETGLLAASLGLLSVGLGFIAIGMSTKSDKRYTDLLDKLNRNVANLPQMLKGDSLTPFGQQMADEAKQRISQEEKIKRNEQSKIAAQKRLDEDTKKVGFVRGELYQTKDGSWAIAWGGKYPL